MYMYCKYEGKFPLIVDFINKSQTKKKTSEKKVRSAMFSHTFLLFNSRNNYRYCYLIRNKTFAKLEEGGGDFVGRRCVKVKDNCKQSTLNC